MLTDPIAALATPPGRSALAVIRLSGDGAFDVAGRVIPGFRTDRPRVALLAAFRARAVNRSIADSIPSFPDPTATPARTWSSSPATAG